MVHKAANFVVFDARLLRVITAYLTNDGSRIQLYPIRLLLPSHVFDCFGFASTTFDIEFNLQTLFVQNSFSNLGEEIVSLRKTEQNDVVRVHEVILVQTRHIVFVVFVKILLLNIRETVLYCFWRQLFIILRKISLNEFWVRLICGGVVDNPRCLV